MKTFPFHQGHPDWLAWRLGGIGGSDAGIILFGEMYGVTRADLLAEKVTGTRRETNFAMRRGTRLEPVARGLYERCLGVVAKPLCVMHDSIDWLLASSDGLVAPPGVDPWVIEIKCPCWQDHETALYGYLPPKYVPQVQHVLFAMNLKRCDYVSYTENERFGPSQKLAVVTVQEDAEYQARLLEEEEKFWAQVLAGRVARFQAAGTT